MRGVLIEQLDWERFRVTGPGGVAEVFREQGRGFPGGWTMDVAPGHSWTGLDMCLGAAAIKVGAFVSQDPQLFGEN